MEWLSENWFWVLIVVVFIAMHLFGHGGHGGHGGHEEHEDYEGEKHPPKRSDSGTGHRHH